jgi:hypothetical protein
MVAFIFHTLLDPFGDRVIVKMIESGECPPDTYWHLIFGHYTQAQRINQTGHISHQPCLD